jgi:adenylate cyclase
MAAPRRTVPFSISILTLMALIVLPLCAALLWLGWRSVEFLEKSSAEQRMTALHGAVAGFIANSVRVVIAAGEVMADGPVFRAPAGESADDERRRELMALLGRHPTLSAAYVGYPDGRLLYVGHTSFLSPEITRAFSVPKDASLLVHTIAGEGATRRQTWWFDRPVASAGSVQSRPNDFDPRVRPWYVDAERRKAPALTDPYGFAWATDIGVSAGVPIAGGGALGFDFTLATLADLLGAYKITPNSIIALTTRTSDVAIESKPCVATTPGCLGGDAEVRRTLRRIANEANDQGRRIERNVEVSGRDYRLIVEAIPPVFGKPLTVAAAVPVAELQAASRTLLERAALAAGLAILLGIVAVGLASLLLSRSLARIAAKTERIGNLDFSDHVPVISRITEILKLSNAVEHMREGLQVFGLYVSRELVSEIMRAPGKTGLGGTRRQLTVMFTDIEGFSRIAETIKPELLTARLSRYFDVLGTAISAHRGMIDKYIGDSIMAFWNAPQPDPDHIFNACAAALEAADGSRRLAVKWHERRRPVFHTRIGLHTGLAVVGNVGARTRINYTLVGAVANQASRLEGLNKIYGTEILASGEIAAATADRLVWRHIDRIVAAGTTETHDLYELLGEIGDAAQHAPFLEKWQAARHAYIEGRFAAALEGFQVALADRPHDKACRAYIERCAELARQPAPASWDGVWHFDKK